MLSVPIRKQKNVPNELSSFLLKLKYLEKIKHKPGRRK